MSWLGDLSGREIVAFGLGGLIALASFNNGVAHARMVPSGSMAPLFTPGDRILVAPQTVGVHEVERGDVLIFKPPFGAVPGEDTGGAFGMWTISEHQTYVKRAVGLPGDLIQVRKQQGVFVNGRLLDEPYVIDAPRYDWGPERVPAGQLFMLGDNRNNSFDSHYWGFLPVENVVGRPWALIWPLHRWRGF